MIELWVPQFVFFVAFLDRWRHWSVQLPAQAMCLFFPVDVDNIPRSLLYNCTIC